MGIFVGFFVLFILAGLEVIGPTASILTKMRAPTILALSVISSLYLLSGPDATSYLNHFFILNTGNTLPKEPGYVLLVELLNYTGLDYFGLQLFFALVIYCVFQSVCPLDRSFYFSAFLVYSFLYMLVSIFSVKQGIAGCFVLMSLAFLRINRIFLSLFFLIISLTFSVGVALALAYISVCIFAFYFLRSVDSWLKMSWISLSLIVVAGALFLLVSSLDFVDRMIYVYIDRYFLFEGSTYSLGSAIRFFMVVLISVLAIECFNVRFPETFRPVYGLWLLIGLVSLLLLGVLNLFIPASVVIDRVSGVLGLVILFGIIELQQESIVGFATELVFRFSVMFILLAYWVLWISLSNYSSFFFDWSVLSSVA